MARPAEFDRQDVLIKAMNTFWRTGYTGTSINDLVTATDLKPGSLYGAFDSKRRLFFETVDLYANRTLLRVETTLLESTSPLQGVFTFFDRLCADLASDNSGKGCLLLNTLMELGSEDQELRNHITAYLNQVEKVFEKTLERARQAGELGADADCTQLAKFLMTAIWGLRVLNTTLPERSAYQQVCQTYLSALPVTVRG